MPYSKAPLPRVWRQTGKPIHGAKPLLPARKSKIWVEPIDASRGFDVAAVFHRPGPEPALGVGRRVVETAARQMGFGIADGVPRAGLEIKEPETGLRGQHQAATVANGKAADRLAPCIGPAFS